MNRSQRCTFGKVVLTLFPIAYWWRGGMSFTSLVIIAVVLNLGLSAWDNSRGYRCPVSYILGRMVVTYWVFLGWPLVALFDWCMGFYFGYAMMLWMVLPCLISHTFARYFIFPNLPDAGWTAGIAADQERMNSKGWSAIWDRGIIGMANPDSECMRLNGFDEPEYTNFTPPSHWGFRCPVCGARCPESWGVCWNCNYGADGDATAYHERYGRKD